jgi:branched-chain amino acid transport system substrate-binding protein
MTRALALSAVALAALLAGCAGGGSASGTGGSASPSAAASGAIAVKLGIDLPLSGADATDGKPTANGAQLAIEQADARGIAGGKITVSADLLDDAVQGKHDPAAGAQNVKTFIDDPAVLAMVGPFNSNVAKSEIPLTNDAGLTQIGPSVVADGLTVGADARALRSAHPDVNAFFRVCTRNSKQGAALAAFAKKEGWKRIYVIDDDETYGKDLADVFAARVALNGATVVGRDHLTANQQDFKALLTKAKALAPQAVFFGGTTSTGGGLVRRQMEDVGLGALPFLGGDGISDQEFISVAGSEADGTYYTVAAPDAAKLPSARAFVAAYTKRFGAAPGPYSANAYAAAQIAIAAIEKAALADPSGGPTRAEVRQNVAAAHVATPIGTVGFDRNGDTTAPLLTLVQIVRGAPQTLDEITLPPN